MIKQYGYVDRERCTLRKLVEVDCTLMVLHLVGIFSLWVACLFLYIQVYLTLQKQKKIVFSDASQDVVLDVCRRKPGSHHEPSSSNTLEVFGLHASGQK